MVVWAKRTALMGVAVGVLMLVTCLTSTAAAQVPVMVTTYYPPQPVVTYYPVRRGLLFPRIVYRPSVSYVAPVAPVPVTSYYAPVAPVTTYYAPAAPIVAAPAPVTTYYAPAYCSPVLGY